MGHRVTVGNYLVDVNEIILTPMRACFMPGTHLRGRPDLQDRAIDEYTHALENYSRTTLERACTTSATNTNWSSGPPSPSSSARPKPSTPAPPSRPSRPAARTGRQHDRRQAQRLPPVEYPLSASRARRLGSRLHRLRRGPGLDPGPAPHRLHRRRLRPSACLGRTRPASRATKRWPKSAPGWATASATRANLGSNRRLSTWYINGKQMLLHYSCPQ